MVAEVSPRMALSRRGVAFLKGWEKLRLEAYLDSRGTWTIGYGHTGPEVHEGLLWSQEQAEYAFCRDTIWACNAVNDYVLVDLTQCQFDALVALVYNIGKAAFFGSTLLVKLNKGDYLGARNQFLVWVRETRDGRKRISKGLVNRRNAEVALWDDLN